MVESNNIKISVRCYAELNDYLPPEYRYRDSLLIFSFSPTVQNVLDVLNLDTQYVDLIVRDKVSIDLSTILADGERISIYPTIESFDISSIELLHPTPLRNPKFIADVHLGKLARLLRLTGFDTIYFNTFDEDRIIQLSVNERRCILSMSSRYHSNTTVQRFFQICSTSPYVQLQEVFNRFDLWNSIKPFTRCLKCNSVLQHMTMANAQLERIPQRVRSWCSEYQYCFQCNQYFWKGSHYEKLKHFIDDFLNSNH